MKRILILFVVSVLALQVFAQKKREISTAVNVNYCLPKVVYKLEVIMDCIQYIPGPYWKYAEKELSLTPKVIEAKERWKIADIKVSPQYVPDEKAMYSVAASADYWPVALTLSAEGFLAGIAGGKGEVVGNYSALEYHNNEIKDIEVIDITKLNTYNHLKEVLDTNYTFQEVDGEMKKIWDPIIRYASKTELDNVKEAVSEIFRIRSERVRLLNADNNVPDGKSLEIILKEYDRMEANYLSLFMGKKITNRVKKVVYCTPLKADEPTLAFRFAENEGITDSKNVSALAYFLQVSDVTVPSSKSIDGEADVAGIFYRVPAMGKLQLLCGKDILMKMETMVPQLGEIKRFPLDIISNEGLSLEFYPQFGSLKSVKRSK